MEKVIEKIPIFEEMLNSLENEDKIIFLEKINQFLKNKKNEDEYPYVVTFIEDLGKIYPILGCLIVARKKRNEEILKDSSQALINEYIRESRKWNLLKKL